MDLTVEEVRKIALLARLKLSAEEEQKYAKQLSAILEFAAQLQEVDTSSIPPTTTVLPLSAPLREDTIRPSIPQDEILANAPSSEDGMFRVAPVLEQEP